MFIKFFFRKRRPCPNGEVGQSLFEILIAVALVGVVLGLGAALVFAALQSAERARIQTVAGRLASELMESATAIAASSWNKIYCPPTGEGTGTCASQKGTANKYYSTSTLMAYWPMDELSGTAVGDTSGFGNTGTANGTTIVDGYSLKARQFNGSSDFIEVQNNPSLNPSNITVSVWAKSNTATWNENGFLVSKRDAYVIHPNSGASTVSFYIYTSAWQGITCTPSSAITNWNLYTFTWNGTNLRGYINGTLCDSSAPGGSINTGDTGSLFIGRDDGLARYFNGVIDEPRVYNRALPQFEIQQHYLKAKETLTKTPASGTESLVFGNNTYTRWFTVENVSRALADQAIETTYESTRDDPSTQKITVWVAAERLLATSSVVQYITRSRNEIYLQNNWSCGNLGETAVSGQPCGYSSSSANVSADQALRLQF